MKSDIRYWQTAQKITVEPRTIQGKTALTEKFPFYEAGKSFKAYVAGTGVLRWEFPSNSSELEGFLTSDPCIKEKIA